MRGTHEHADNLLLRLFTYSPRKDRKPLEDYCSEALAWCLDNSLEFRRRFLGLTKLKVLKNAEEKVQINTQQSYKEKAADGERLSKKGFGGRFDITMEAEDASFYVAIESKVGSRFGNNQVKKYLKRLATVERSQCFAQCHLVTLTNVRDTPFDHVAHVAWGDVHKALKETVSSEARLDGSINTFVLELLKQFATFLEEKGLAHMTISKVTPHALNQFSGAMHLQDSIEAILKSLKTAKHLATLLDRKRVKYEPDHDNKRLYLGCYARTTPFLYLGFELDQSEASPSLFMYIEISMKGDQRKLLLPRGLKKCKRTFEDGYTWSIWRQAVDGPYDGNAEAMRDWFIDISKGVMGLKKRPV